MADEATIRIVIQDGGVTTTGGTTRVSRQQSAPEPAGKPAKTDPYKKDSDTFLQVAEKLGRMMGGTVGQLVGAGANLFKNMPAKPAQAEVPELEEFIPTLQAANKTQMMPAGKKTQMMPAGKKTQLAQPSTQNTDVPTLEPLTPDNADMLASMLPEIGAAIVVLKAADNAMLGLVKSTESTIRAVGSFGAAVAKPGADIPAYAQAFGGGLEKVGETLRWYGGIYIAAIGSATVAFGNLVGATDQASKYYAKYNAQLAGAEAVGNIRQVYGDFRRAQELAPNLSEFSLAYSKLGQDVEDVKASLLNKFLPALTRLVEIADEGVVAGAKAAELLVSVAEFAINFDVKSLNDAILKFLRPANDPIIIDPTTAILAGDVAVPPL